MKKLLAVVAVVGLAIGGYYAVRLLPLVTEDNAGAERIVMLHGFGRTELAMLLLESAVTDAGYRVHNIGYPTTEIGPEALVELISAEIDACCLDSRETVHFVGHSLGGLLIRAYLARRQPENLGRVVLLGTPNHGSELADVGLGEDESLSALLLELAGPMARALTTGANGFAASLPPPGYPVGVIAGTRDNPLANQWLPLPNDGMVSVESARLEGMSDFTTFDVSHWTLRNDSEVAEQVVEFLANGRFSRGLPR